MHNLKFESFFIFPPESLLNIMILLLYYVIDYFTLFIFIYVQGLKGLDVNGLCDSYCRVTLVPPSKKVFSKKIKKSAEKW